MRTLAHGTIAGILVKLSNRGAKTVKTISLWQPYASLSALGFKKIETRGWSTDYRGPLGIHAAKKIDIPTGDPSFMDMVKACGLTYRDLLGFPRGAVVATCNLVDCIRMTRSNILQIGNTEKAFGLYEPDRYMWILSDIKALAKPYFCRGYQGFFNVELPL
jgi:hypothetical protein